MACFEKAAKFTLGHEGGFVDHASDPGGATKYGISLRTLLSLSDSEMENFDVDGDGVVDVDDIRNMSREQAVALYREKYWLPVFAKLEAQEVATKVFDMSVNMGVTQATRLVQRALNRYGRLVKVDGRFGPMTLAAVNGASCKLAVHALCNEQMRFYYGLVNAKPKLKVFLLGWMRRAFAEPAA